MSEFGELDDALDGLLQGLEPAGRNRLAGAIATDVRNAHAQRLRANVTPEGAPMAPRKRRTGPDAKAGAMFVRAAGGSHLMKRLTPEAVEVGFLGAAARIMAVHHHGLRDRVSRESGAPEVTYAERPVVGLSADDRVRMLDKVAAHVAGE